MHSRETFLVTRALLGLLEVFHLVLCDIQGCCANVDEGRVYSGYSSLVIVFLYLKGASDSP